MDEANTVAMEESVKKNEYENSTPFSGIAGYWKEFDLENTRVQLDEQGLKIAENQESSLKNRRKLASATKDFRKAEEAEKPSLFPGLLRFFQEEVDNLTKRAKYAESAFLGIYQKLYEAPDPTHALAAATEASRRLADVEGENRRLRAELDEFRAESAHLRNQAATVRRLEERNRQLELQMEEKVKEMVAMKQQVLAEESQKSLEALKERENELHNQLRAAKESVHNMHKLHELGQSQLFELQEKSEEEKGSKQTELNLLQDEVERATSRLTALEREKEALKAQLAAVQSDGSRLSSQLEDESSGSSSSSRFEALLSAKQKLILDLNVELEQLEADLAQERRQNAEDLRKMTKMVEEKEAEVNALQSELATRPTKKTVEDLKRQVKMLQAVGYNSVEIDGWDAPLASSDGGGDVGRLEALLLDKNRKMEHELMQAKVQLAEKTREGEVLSEQLLAAQKTAAEQKLLIGRLEEDILKGSTNSENRATRLDEWEGQDSGITGLLKNNDSGNGNGNPNGDVSFEDNSVLAVVCGQRDRFKQRMGELEEELRRVRDRCHSVTGELEKCKAENLALYEKFRYLQEFHSGRDKGRVGKRDKFSDDLEYGSASEVETKYRKLYEENINPFAAFSNKEREQRYKDLGFRDRIALRSGRFLLSNKYARNFVFFYSILLHLLVFISMYQLSRRSYYSVSATYSSTELQSKKGALRALERMAKNATITN